MTQQDIWFTADTHFGHDKIRGYCRRPFETVAEMDQALISNWNARVQPDDDVYHLGDFGFGSQGFLHGILDQLNGRIHFIRGNHDKNVKKTVEDRFVWVKDYHELTTEVCFKICMFHYPMRTWRSKHYGAWALHGHCHGNLPALLGDLTVDVGVDVWDYAPVSLRTLGTYFENVIRVQAELNQYLQLVAEGEEESMEAQALRASLDAALPFESRLHQADLEIQKRKIMLKIRGE